MEFFMPKLEEKDAKQLYTAIVKFAGETVNWPVNDRKIYRLRYNHDGKIFEAIVGEPEAENGISKGEVVMAILETSKVYLVCKPNRGVFRDMPILVGKEEVLGIEDFES